MSYACVKVADARRTGLLRDWAAWLKHADELYTRFVGRLDGDSPFDYHEVASVGFLANAAAMAGFLPMNEYDVMKRGRRDKRTKVAGRADLWFDAGKRCYSLEFKRTRRPATVAYLKQRLDYAYADVDCVQSDEYHHAAACLVTVAREPKRLKVCKNFADSNDVDLAYCKGPAKEAAFLFFRMKV